MVYWVIGGIVVALAIMFAVAFHAPEGWEDDDGFHYGKPKEKEDADENIR